MIRNILILTAFVFVVFSPCLKAEFLNFDDDGHVLNNPALSELSPSSIKQIFIQTPNDTYIPLTLLSFAIEKYFFGFNSFVFHLDNLLFFTGVVILILLLAKRMGLSPEASFVAALIFAIHPMRVETVAWVTERKDVLYAFFYLLALHQYWSYLKTSSKQYYFLTLFFGLLSILAKPMALSLPLILFVFDWFEGRKFSKKVLFEKAPMFIYIIAIAWISYALNMRNPIGDISHGFLIWIWSFSFYIWKFIFPFFVHPYYALPHPINIFYWPYTLSVVFLLALILLVICFYHQKLFVFAFLYFFLSIFFLLRFDEKDFNIVADRFMFLPSLGICFFIGYWVNQRLKSRTALIIFYILLVLLGIRTNAQCQIWHDSISFWNEMIRINPESFGAYNNRGLIFYQTKKDALALNDFNKAIALNPKAAKVYFNRSLLKEADGEYSSALQDAVEAKKLGENVSDVYLNRLESEVNLSLGK